MPVCSWHSVITARRAGGLPIECGTRRPGSAVRVLRRVLFGLGAAVLALYALTSWLGSSSMRFASAQSVFINQFLSDLSQRWELTDVEDRVSGPLARQAGSPEGQRELTQFRPLGALRLISELQLQRYALSDDDRTGVFSARAQFAHGGAHIQIIVTQHHNAVRVESLQLYRLTPSIDPDLPQTET